MAAEFAMVLPAVMLVLAFAAGAVQVGAAQVRLTDAAADAARLVGRGESESRAASRLQDAVGGAALAVSRDGLLVCVTATASVTLGPMAGAIDLGARGCAYDDTLPATP
ncbi:TadE family type IV pilus minor pilin [Herbiconiux solani]|uniref:TadE family type IV pilus minor pilin n=1 Tax=Herbiconiux solani TaxID=661329 RepID=UPI001FE1DA9A|nr:TadE family type IV pilus minor pilin [Herbiconiux solani]